MAETLGRVRGWLRELAPLDLCFIALFFAVVIYLRKPSRKLPPGPRGWPVFGSLLSLGTKPHRTLAKLSKTYGPLMIVHLGSKPTLVVTSPEMAKEILVTNGRVMASRPLFNVTNIITYHGQDIAYNPYDQHWRNKRRLCTQELLSPAHISRTQATRRREVVAVLHSVLEISQEGEVPNMRNVFSQLALNNLCQMLMGKSYYGKTMNSNEAEAVEFRESNREMTDMFGVFNIADYIPILRPLDLHRIDKRINQIHKKLDKFFEGVLEEHRKNKAQSAKEGKDFVDLMLELSEDGKEYQESLTNEAIKGIMLDMIFAGVDTSAVVMEWLLVEVMKSPKVMRKVLEELDAVIGPNRLVEETDIPNLPYFHAVVKETFRLHPPVPFLIPHESTEDCEVAGYHVPGGTRVYTNVWAIQRDPRVWENPLEFDPDRFLNSKVDVKGADFQLLPFGSGRRMCAGMNLGLLKVQYPLALLLHACDWSLPGNENPEKMDVSEIFGFVLYRKDPLCALAKSRLPAHVIYA